MELGEIPHFPRDSGKWDARKKEICYLNDFTAEASSSFTSKTV